MELQLDDVMEKFEKANITEMEVETKEMRIFLKKGSDAPVMAAPVMQAMATAAVPAQQIQQVQTLSPQESVIEGTGIRAPIVGTFYAASKPGEAPFVAEGQQVKKGDTVGLVEAMKIMNEILAPADGVITSVQVADGSFIEFDQLLMTMKEN